MNEFALRLCSFVVTLLLMSVGGFLGHFFGSDWQTGGLIIGLLLTIPLLWPVRTLAQRWAARQDPVAYHWWAEQPKRWPPKGRV